MTQSRTRTIITIVECLSVFAAGSVLGYLIAQLFGITLSNPLTLLVEQPDAPLAPLALKLAQVLCWQYLGWALCVALMQLLRPRAESSALAATDALPDWRRKAEFTLLLCALCVLPSVMLTQAQQIWHIGDRAPWFDALQQRPWDWQYWLFTAIGSYALIPLLEEWFYRGYLFRTLARFWSPIAAVALSASLFAFSHSQYLQLDLFNLGMLTNLLYLGALLALATAYTGSLLPAIIAHAVINLPLSPVAAGAVLVIAATVLAAGRARLQAHGKAIRAMLGDVGPSLVLGPVLIGVIYGLVLQRTGTTLALAAMPIVLALCLYYGSKRLIEARTKLPSGARTAHRRPS